MTTATARIDGDLRVTGDLQVDGAMPDITRDLIAQDQNAVFAVPLTDLRIHDAIDDPLTGTASADDLELDNGTFGTSAPTVQTGDVKNSTVTRYARFLYPLEPEYDDGNSVTVRVSAGMITTVASVAATLDVEVYKHDREGGVGSDLCTTAAQSINSLTFANKDFDVSPSGLTAGDVLDIRLTLAVEDSATATAVIAAIGALEMLLDIRG